MRVFLTGATGYMGGTLLEKLLGRGAEVLALARPTRRDTLRPKAGLEWVFGQLDDPDVMTSAARRTDATIHIGAQHDSTMQRLDAAALNAIVAGLKGSGKKFITTSASPVYGDTGSVPRDEHEPVENPFPMRRFRLEHDRIVANAPRADVCGIVIRPPFVYGRAAGFLVTLINQAIEDRVARTIGDGANRWSTVNVDDLAELYVLALLNERASGVYNAGSEDVASMREIAEAVAEAFGPGIDVATWTEREAVARLGELMPMMALEQRISSRRAYSELGWKPGRTSLLADLRTGSYRQSALVPYSH